jgi:hypothetical protein
VSHIKAVFHTVYFVGVGKAGVQIYYITRAITSHCSLDADLQLFYIQFLSEFIVT